MFRCLGVLRLPLAGHTSIGLIDLPMPQKTHSGQLDSLDSFTCSS